MATLSISNDEELKEFPAVRTRGPFLIPPHMKYKGNTKLTQAAVAMDEAVAFAAPSRLRGFILGGRGSRPEGRLAGQVGESFKELLKSQAVLVPKRVGGGRLRNSVPGGGTDGDDGHLGKVLAHHREEINP